ncbi:diamine acetyltransferase 1-like [Antennarius striatus]|uniref:diamine acetyltransferase 1-like n=1 Tax=Antennarius striatus TaxID=241820 RepID=UPI0035B05E62
MEFSIRPATRDDCKDLARMLRELADYHEITECVTQTDLEQDGFRENPCFHFFIAEVPEQHKSKDGYTKIGMAFYYFSYSMIYSRSISLENLYVMDEFRGKGVGKALFKKVAQEGVAAGCREISFIVIHWNKPAFGFYFSQGCQDMTIEKGYHLVSCSGAAMERLGRS